MSRDFQYRCVGHLAIAGDQVEMQPQADADPQGIVAFVEHGAPATERLQTAQGALRYLKDGRLIAVLARPHPMARQALREGAEIGVYIHLWDDPMAAASAAKRAVEADQPPWNMGIRR